MYIDGTSGKFLISFDIPLVIYSFIFSGGGGTCLQFRSFVNGNCHLVMYMKAVSTINRFSVIFSLNIINI